MDIISPYNFSAFKSLQIRNVIFLLFNLPVNPKKAYDLYHMTLFIRYDRQEYSGRYVLPAAREDIAHSKGDA